MRSCSSDRTSHCRAARRTSDHSSSRRYRPYTHAVDQYRPRNRQGIWRAIAEDGYLGLGVRALAEPPEFLRTAPAGILGQIDTLSRQVAAYDQQVVETAKRLPEIDRLSGIPRVGALTALAFVLTLGRAERFAHSPDVAGFLGLRPKQHQSGARDPQLAVSKSRGPYLRKLLVQCAHYILGRWGPDSALRRWGLAKSEGGKRVALRAIVAVARKLAVLLHRLWTSGAPYKPFPQKA